MLNKSKGKDRGMSRERRMSPSPSRAQYESLKIADGKVIEGAKMTLGNKNVEKEKLVLIGKKKMENNVNIVDKSHD